MPDPNLSTDPYASLPHVPDEIGITMIDGNAADMKVSLTEFLNEQRALIDSELQANVRSIEYWKREVARKQAILTMIDEHLAELAQPVEPGVDTIDTTLLGDGRGVQS